MKGFTMITYLQVEQLLHNFKKCLAYNETPHWAVRDKKARYLAASPDYVHLLAQADTPLTVAALDLDEISKASLLYQDSLAFKRQDKLTSLQAVIVKERLALLEVTRYPLHDVDNPSSPLALGITIRKIHNPEQLNSAELVSAHIPNNLSNELKERDLLIGLLLLDNCPQKTIAKYLQISHSRLCHILFRVCRRNFGVTGGGAKFRELFIQHALYRQIPLGTLKTYLTLTNSCSIS